MIPSVLPRVLLSAIFALGIVLLHRRGWSVSFPLLGSLVPSLVLGLLLVFRTNTSYERFWEGRKLWGNVVNLTRNLARQMWVAIETPQPADLGAKIEAVRLLPAFAVAMKLHLRGEAPDADLASLISAERYAKLQGMNNPPLEIAFWVADYLQTQQAQGVLNTHQLTYCLQMVASMGWVTPLVVGLISFAVFGIEEIGIEIENPFGHDANDLPLDAICRTMQQNTEDLISLVPGEGRYSVRAGLSIPHHG